ncbi:MAG: threonylcarbamoyl-AMP synthase [Piscinibacter sp.]|nr:threonylcarbamoyl-AMP synthase [Piscinibacter sp.]
MGDAHEPPGDPGLAAAVRAAARTLADGGLVAFPTETVYGLGARADDDRAVGEIFVAKGRPTDHPLIVHVAGADQAAHFASEIPPVAQGLIAAFWPGPLTLIVPRRPGVGDVAASGLATVGLRCPAHPVARALLEAARALGVPGVAAPSANRFGRISPTTAQHVRDDLGAALCVLDGGACDVGIESAIVDCSRGHPVLLRPGAIARERLAAAAGEALRAPDLHAPRASGTLEAHYAPRARLHLATATALRSGVEAAAKSADGRVAVYSRSTAQSLGLADVSRLVWRGMPDDAAAAAHELFAVLRELDRPDTAHIWVEEPPATPAWEGVRDRLQRAAAAG